MLGSFWSENVMNFKPLKNQKCSWRYFFKKIEKPYFKSVSKDAINLRIFESNLFASGSYKILRKIWFSKKSSYLYENGFPDTFRLVRFC